MASKDSERGDIVVVTLGAFMKYLSGDPTIDLPKAGWKSYTIEEGGAACIPVLVKHSDVL